MKDLAEPHYNLARALRQQGEFRKALEEMRRSHELGSQRPSWRYPTAQWVRQLERLVELDERLPNLLAGKDTLASAGERVEVAELCTLKHLNRAALRFFEEAFRAVPGLGPPHRYNAACAAALVARGQGADARNLDDQERARLRQQALTWLRADLSAWSRQVATGQISRSRLKHALTNWQKDPDLAGLRDAVALKKLPANEQTAWRELWTDVADLLKKK
jgi:hypothetical protein